MKLRCEQHLVSEYNCFQPRKHSQDFSALKGHLLSSCVRTVREHTQTHTCTRAHRTVSDLPSLHFSRTVVEMRHHISSLGSVLLAKAYLS